VKILIDHPSVSRRHASLVVREDAVVLHDHQSRNRTFLNGRRIDGPAEVRDGDIVSLRPVTLVVEMLSAAGTTKTDLTR
jgi:pSer/pThr/pTyr-binding forkhead associated (FHA) protein